MLLLFLFTLHTIKAQSIDNLKQKIEEVLKDKSATVGVAIQGMNPEDAISINGNRHMPMQSVFKFHLALAVLHQVDQGKLSLDQVITLDKALMEKYKHLWAPLRKKYPNGGKVTIAEMLKSTVAWSDNIGCDVLLNRIGGVKALESYLHQIGIKEIRVVHDEISMQAKWENQYENWTTVKAANQTLQLFFENKDNLLSAKSHDFLLNVLKGTQTGKKSIKGLLPQDAVVAHKTGHSGKNDQQLTAALNDIGIVFLPNGTYFYLSIMVNDSMEDNETNQKIIAEIAKLTWDHFKKK